MSTFADIFSKNQYQLRHAVHQSKNWFQQQAQLLSRQQIAPLKLIQSAPEQNRNKVVVGNMYLFGYDAKHQDNLPYWDMFPLVFPFSRDKDTFTGLNLHYLPYQLRVQLLDRLMEYRTNSLLNENTRLRYTWATISGVAKFKLAHACVHKYLFNRVQTQFKQINASDWTTALMLPVERFVGASKQNVWTESLKK